jgi:hypothetical protein
MVSQQGAACQLGGLGGNLTTQCTCYEMLHRVLDFAGSCKHGNEPSDSKLTEFFD